VVIVDGDGTEGVSWLLSRELPSTWVVVSRRGCHWWFRYPQALDFEIRNSESALYAHVDVRGLGGMAVFPGSAYPVEGGIFTYRWQEGHSPRDGALADLPGWLLDWFRQRAEMMKVRPSVSAKAYAGTMTAWGRKALTGPRA
jgi:Bifunctional DNA primase/polymerase, N-terminal